MAEVPPNVTAARQKVQNSDFYALCYLMLCQLSYSDEGDGHGAVDQIREQLPNMPAPQGDAQAQWTLSWGPAVTSDNSNLMYGAQYSLAGLPVFSAVVIRGTDLESTPWGVLQQLFEDIDALNQVAFPSNQTAAKIANGSFGGLQILKKLTDPQTGQTVEAYVQNFVANNPDVPVVVTGHSLGGCQTTVLALDLASQLPNQTIIVPTTFAAPTAGNAAFMDLYEQRFQFCPRWFNNIDLVPMAFAGISGIAGLWKQCQRPAPIVVKILAVALSVLLKRLGYTQESPANSRTLQGSCQQARALALPPGIEAQAVKQVAEILTKVAPKMQAAAEPVLGEAAKLLSDLPFIGGEAGLLSAQITAESFQNLEAWVQELLFQHLVLTGYWNSVQNSPGVAFIPNPFDQAAAAGTA
jgi:hypothetical protein